MIYYINERHNSNMKKVFISIPMNNKSDDQIHSEMNAAKDKLSKIFNDEFEVLDSFINETYDSPLMYIAKSIEILSKADAAYFVKGWQSARGCNIERLCCEEYGIPIIEDTPIVEYNRNK